MLKTVALLLLFFVCSGAGVGYARALQVRTRELTHCLEMLSQLRTQLLFSRPSLSQMIKAICETQNSPIFLQNCYKRLQTQQTFPEAWQDAVEEAKALKPEDKRQLLGIGAVLGGSTADQQCDALALHEGLLQTQLSSARENLQKQEKACISLGVLTGLSLMILFF